MPCGGIWPLLPDDELAKGLGSSDYDQCFFCNGDIKQEDLMWCEEWDCYLHRACVIPFLETEEGKVVLAHGHQVILYFSKDTNGNQSEQ